MKKYILIFAVLVGVGFGFSVHAAQDYQPPYGAFYINSNYPMLYSSSTSETIPFDGNTYLYQIVPPSTIITVGNFTGNMINGQVPFSALTNVASGTTLAEFGWLPGTSYAMRLYYGATYYGQTNDFEMLSVASSSFVFYEPFNLQIVNQDFTDWRFGYTRTPGAYSPDFHIWSGTTSTCLTTSTGCYDDSSIWNDIQVDFNGDEFQFLIQKTLPISSGNTFYAHIVDLNEPNVSSSIIFYKPYGPVLPPYSPPPFPTSAPPGIYVQSTSTDYECGPPTDILDVGGGISFGLCKFTLFMLRPHTVATTALANAWQNFEGAFPFSVVYNVLRSVQKVSLSNSTSSAVALTYSIPQLNMSGTILSATTLQNAVGTSTKEQIFQGEEYLLWIILGFALIKLIL